MLMFSVNPAYDYNHGEYAYGGVDERADVYKRCEKLCEVLQSRKYWKNNEWESIEKINAKTLLVTLILLFFCSMIPYATDLVSGDFNNKLDWDHMQ